MNENNRINDKYLNDRRIRYEIISLFKETILLRFKDIQQKLEEKRISKKKICDVLKEMVEEGVLEKTEDGYKLKILPKQFSIIKKLEELYSKYEPTYIYQWRYGGMFWASAEGIIIGIPEDIDENPHYKEILRILLTRLVSIYEAIRSIALTIGFAKEKGLNIYELPPPKEAVREYLLNIIPHVLGNRSGIDFDGLPTDDLLEIIEQICHEMPNEFRSQPIRKELLLEMISYARNLNMISHDLEDLEECIELGSWGDSRFKELYDKYSKAVLIVYPPRFVLDEEGEKERTLYTSLEECINENKSIATMLVHIKDYEEEIVNKVLNNLELYLLKKDV